ncbi:MAG: glycoside hydrolase family 3 protein [Pyrinomonadaceae bacterium]
MKKLLVSTILLATFAANPVFSAPPRLGGFFPAHQTTRFKPSKKAWDFAAKYIAKMSVEEKIGQLIHIGVNAKFANQNSAVYKDLQRQVVENKIGGIIFFVGPVYETVHLINRMQAAAKTPLLMSLDAETGVGMRFLDADNFPWAMAVAATGELELARHLGVITGREARATGFRQVFAPVLDVNNNAANPVINVRSFGEDPNQVADFGIAFAEGLQSQNVLATAKHFPGHGDTNVDSHRGLPIIDHSLEQLEKLELLPFKKAVNAGVGSIMIGHIALPKIDGEEIKPLQSFIQGDAEQGAELLDQKTTIPASLSHKIQTDLLRKQMGFNGLIVSDAMSMSGLTIYFSQEEAAVRAILAGTDILEKPADVEAMIRGLKAAVANGRIPISRLDDAVKRQTAWKYELGLFKNRITPIEYIDRVVSSTETAALSDEIATKAITLVRNENGILPLDRNAKIAVIGISNGFDGTATMSSFVGGLRNGGLKFSSAYVQENSLPEQISAARKAVDDADVIVVGLYGRVRTGAKNSVGIPENGAAILREALAANKKVIGISFGNPYILSDFPTMKTYVVAYGDMPSLQRAAARSILGLQDITGKLPITLPGLHPRGTGIQLKKN